MQNAKQRLVPMSESRYFVSFEPPRGFMCVELHSASGELPIFATVNEISYPKLVLYEIIYARAQISGNSK